MTWHSNVLMYHCCFTTVHKCIVDSMKLNFTHAFTVSSWKYTAPLPLPPYAHHFEAKVERGRLLEYLISLVHTPPQFLAMLHSRSIIMTTAVTFWKNGQQLRWTCTMSLSYVVAKYLGSSWRAGYFAKAKHSFGHNIANIELLVNAILCCLVHVKEASCNRWVFCDSTPEAFLVWFMAALCWSLFAWSTTQLVLWFVEPLIQTLE